MPMIYDDDFVEFVDFVDSNDADDDDRSDDHDDDNYVADDNYWYPHDKIKTFSYYRYILFAFVEFVADDCWHNFPAAGVATPADE